LEVTGDSVEAKGTLRVGVTQSNSDVTFEPSTAIVQGNEFDHDGKRMTDTNALPQLCTEAPTRRNQFVAQRRHVRFTQRSLRRTNPHGVRETPRVRRQPGADVYVEQSHVFNELRRRAQRKRQILSMYSDGRNEGKIE
jgi:hypothetical protein